MGRSPKTERSECRKDAGLFPVGQYIATLVFILLFKIHCKVANNQNGSP